MHNLNSIVKKQLFFFVLLTTLSFSVNAQLIIDSDGLWEDTDIWTTGNVADDITEDASINNNTGAVSINSDFTTGNVDLRDKNYLTISTTYTYNIGRSGNPKDLTADNNAELHVDGDLTIWGNLTVLNRMKLYVSGNLIIKGHADLANTAYVNVSGTMQVDSSFTASNNFDLVVDGVINIDGDFTTGSGATTSGTGSVTINGTCSSDICGTGPLPVELYTYEVKLENNNVRIEWATASEIDNDYFVVERSMDAYHFEEIGRAEGAGNSFAFQYYGVTDRFPLEGISYYRLKQVDFDGKTAYFDIKMVDNKDGYTDKHGLTVFPNPIIMGHNKFSIGLEGFEGKAVQVKIQNMSGFLIYSDEINIAQEHDLIELETNIIQYPGMYIVSVFTDDRWYHYKFMFRR